MMNFLKPRRARPPEGVVSVDGSKVLLRRVLFGDRMDFVGSGPAIRLVYTDEVVDCPLPTHTPPDVKGIQSPKPPNVHS
jgi:hypothetical protein